MNWFERLAGFAEVDYMGTRERLEVEGSTLRSTVNGRSDGIGTFEMPSMADLRARVAGSTGAEGKARITIVQGDVRRMHLAPEYAGALFQVASQFNALEMVGPSMTPEDGVTRYEHDRTQGPACAIAAGAATIYRNYFVPVGGQLGQTAERQLDGLADVGAELAIRLGAPVDFGMRNGYVLPSRATLGMIGAHFRGASPEQVDALAGMLRVGAHLDVEVTDASTLPGPLVSQVFCSALPVAYGRFPQQHWAPFAQMVLNAAYEATMLLAVLNARRGASNIVLLTLLGGGAFGNDEAWIHAAIRRAVQRVADFNLDIRLVSYGAPPSELRALVNGLAS